MAMSASGASTAMAGDDQYYRVTITNLTRNIDLTPFLVATHAPGVHLFQAGKPASPGIELMAEGGDTTELQNELAASGKLHDAVSTGALLHPGESVTVELATDKRYPAVSLAPMMLPTNDGFVALNGVPGPRKGTRMYHSPGYDAGTEINDELCTHIPGPTCGGEGFNADGGEGHVHINNGIHGIGDLMPSDYDWRNPVISVTVRKVKGED